MGGSVTVRLNLNASGYSAAMTKAQSQMKRLADAGKEFGHGTVSSMQASSAAIRVLEGGLTGNIRAAERFIAMIPGIGKALQAAFPVVGGIALAGVFVKIGEEAAKALHTLSQIRNVANEGFTAITEGAQKNADSLRVTNDRLEQEIAMLEHKPINNIALALDEARLRADDLASSLNKDYEAVKKVIEQSQSGFLSKLFNKGVDSQLGSGIEDRLANIRTLARQQRDALKRGDQPGADDLAAKLADAQDAALAFADNETAKRQGTANQGTVREAPYAKVYGDQSTNFDAINSFRDLISSQQDTAEEQKKNTALETQKTALESAKKVAEAQKQAQELLVQQWRKSFDEAKAENDMTLAQDAQFWVQRMESARRGSLSYVAALDEVNKLIAEMRGQNMRQGKEFDKTSAESYLPDNMDLSKSDLGAMKDQGKGASEYLKSLNEGIALQHANRDAIAEASIQMELATGRMDKLSAAQAQAAIHAQDYREAIAAIDAALANAQNLPDGFDKQSTIAGLNNQRSQAGTAYQIQAAQDQQGIASQQIGSGLTQTLAIMGQQWSDMTKQIATVMTRAADTLNDSIVRAATGQKGGFGKAFLGIGQGLLKTGLQGAEGTLLKALHLGGGAKRDGSSPTAALFVQIANAAAGAPSSIGLSSPARTATVGLTSLIPGGSFIQPFIQSILPHFAGGGDVMANYPLIVGERGAELFVPNSAGRIVPNDQLGGGGDNHFHFNIQGSNDPAAIQAAVMRAAPHIVAAAVQANHQGSKRTPQGR